MAADSHYNNKQGTVMASAAAESSTAVADAATIAETQKKQQ